MTIRIVTDSTCDLPPSLAEEYGITVLPAYVNIGEESYLDGVELSRSEFYRQLPGYKTPPTTAAPAIGVFAEAYDRLADDGASEILSVHLASNLSGMLNAARLGGKAAERARVTVFDSRQLTMGLGFIVLQAARAARAGKALPEIVTDLEDTVQRTHVFAALDTLEFLRRSGRVSWAEFGIGTLLRIKLIVHVYDGEVHSLEKVRTFSRAQRHLIEHVRDLGPLEQIALLHTANRDGVRQLKEAAQTLIPQEYDPIAVEVTPTIGAHVGPGALGFACVACPS